MPEGTDTYKGLAVPLFGQSEIKQNTAATDILTLTAITGATGDFLVAQTAGGGEVAVIDAAGVLTVQKLVFGVAEAPITAPTTGLTKGEMFVVWSSATHPVLGMCVSTATQLVQYIHGFNAGTLGIAAT
jgi:hypothetical protein